MATFAETPVTTSVRQPMLRSSASTSVPARGERPCSLRTTRSVSATSTGSATRTMRRTRVLLDGEASGRPEEPGVPVGAPPVGAPFRHRVHHLHPCFMGTGDQLGDAFKGSRLPCLGGQFGQGAGPADHALLALDGEQDRRGGIELLRKLFGRRHGASHLSWNPARRAGPGARG